MKKSLLIMALLATFALLLSAGCSSKAGDSGKNQTGVSETSVDGQPSTGQNAATEMAGLLPLDKSPVAPAWTMKDLSGNPVNLSDFHGKVVILDFWDTWCPPCRKEIPDFINLYSQYEKDGLVIVGAAFARDGLPAVKSFSESNRINYPVVILEEKVAMAYGGLQSIPTTFVIDRDGRARAMHVGFKPKDVFESQIKALL